MLELKIFNPNKRCCPEGTFNEYYNNDKCKLIDKDNIANYPDTG